MGNAITIVASLLPILAIALLLLILKRIADGIDRLHATLDRRLLHIQNALASPDERGEGRWPPEA